MTTIVISPSNVVTFPEGGGHFWVYMQYVLGLRQLGCDVYWLEQFHRSGDQNQDDLMLATFFDRMERYGLGGKAVLYASEESIPGTIARYEYIGARQSEAEALFRRADLLLNFDYRIDPALLSYFRRTALVDIDPGLLQFWISAGQLTVSPHDHYFSIGETVGTPTAMFPDCDLLWNRIRPPVSLEAWPYVYKPNSEAFTTISSWWSWMIWKHLRPRIRASSTRAVSKALLGSNTCDGKLRSTAISATTFASRNRSGRSR